MTNRKMSAACVYMSNCQHDRSDRCYFCIFKNKFVVYKVFLFLLCRSIFKLLQVGIFTVINYEMSVFGQMVYDGAARSEFSGENTEGTGRSLLCLRSVTNLQFPCQLCRCLQILLHQGQTRSAHRNFRTGGEGGVKYKHIWLIINELIFRNCFCPCKMLIFTGNLAPLITVINVPSVMLDGNEQAAVRYLRHSISHK